MSEKTIAVTGATGLVGNHLIRMLLDKGYVVKALVRNPSETLAGLPVEIVYGDLSDKECLTQLCQDVDVLIHTAALISIGDQDPEKVYETNVTGTQNLIQACKQSGVRRLVHFSSVDAVIHHPDIELNESAALDIDSAIVYKRTKALGEQLVMKALSVDFEIIILSPAAIMGPMDEKPSLIGNMLIQMASGQLPILVPGGYCWVDVRDVCMAAIEAIHGGVSGEKYMLGGQWLSLVEIAKMVQSVSNKTVFRGTVPYWLASIGVPFIKIWAAITKSQPLYTRDSLAILKHGSRRMSSIKASAAFGFKPRPVSETIMDTIQWFKQNGQLS